MSSRIISYVRQNALGLVAIFIAMGGSAYAVGQLPKNSVGTEQLRNRAVTGKKVARNSLTGANINASTLGTVPNAKHAGDADQLGGSAAGSYQSRVTGTCASGAISQVNLNGSVGCAAPGGAPTGPAGGDLTGSYPNPSIATGAVTNSKLANPALTITPGSGLTGGGSIALGSGTTLGIAPGGIGTNELGDGSVTTGKFASDAQAPDAGLLGGIPPSGFMHGTGTSFTFQTTTRVSETLFLPSNTLAGAAGDVAAVAVGCNRAFAASIVIENNFQGPGSPTDSAWQLAPGTVTFQELDIGSDPNAVFTQGPATDVGGIWQGIADNGPSAGLQFTVIAAGHSTGAACIFTVQVFES